MRSLWLDLIRIIAVILLLTSHISGYLGGALGQFFGIPNFYYVTLGGVSVTIFIILSGIVLELSYQNRKIVYWQFIRRRLLRIYTVYFLCLLFTILLVIFRHFNSGSFQGNLFTFPNLFLSYTGLYAYFGLWGGPILATSWFIGLIVVLYFHYPIISKFIRRKPNLTLLSR